MAGLYPPPMLEPIAAPQHYAQPSARELRSQAVHRLQVGLFGLCAMLLLVGLANIITDRVGHAPAVEEPVERVVAADAKPEKTASDPLADIGVVPAAGPTPDPPSAESGSGDPLAQ